MSASMAIGSVEVFFDGTQPAGRRASLHSTRGPMVARLIEGREPSEELYRLVGMIYALCPAAQVSALRAAVASARGESPDAGASARLVRAETMLEHLRLFLMELPVALGLPPLPEARALGTLRARLAALVRAPGDTQALVRDISRLARDTVLAGLPETDDAGTLTQAAVLCGGSGTRLSRLFEEARKIHAEDIPSVPFLDTQSDAVRKALFDAVWTEGFTARPALAGAPRQTHALSRMARLMKGLDKLPLPRLLFARLAELACLAGGALLPAPTVQTRAEAGRAIAIVQCARGALMTAVRMEDGLIREPVIVAPTEWNFHPAGAAAHLLNTLAAGSFEAFEREARRSLLLFDACIPCSITEITSHA
ncbi:MAG TPA: hypothetical protein DEO49_02035 [Sutterella sp.]|nr:hypothetical protein [Sutterella sp.]